MAVEEFPVHLLRGDGLRLRGARQRRRRIPKMITDRIDELLVLQAVRRRSRRLSFTSYRIRRYDRGYVHVHGRECRFAIVLTQT